MMSDLLKLLAYGPTGWGDEILAGTWLTIRLALAEFCPAYAQLGEQWL